MQHGNTEDFKGGVRDFERWCPICNDARIRILHVFMKSEMILDLLAPYKYLGTFHNLVIPSLQDKYNTCS